VIPLYDRNPVSRRSIVMPALVIVNVIVFLLVQPTFASGSPDERAAKQEIFAICHAAIPSEVTHGAALGELKPSALDDTGRLFGRVERLDCPHKNVWLAIFVAMFMHASFLHIAGNMLFLWIFGNNIEDRLGRIRFLIFYLLCGLAAAIAQILVTPGSVQPFLGASGAIAGVLGAYIVLFPRARVRTLFFFFFITIFDVPAIVLLGIWFLLQVFQGAGSALGHAGDNVAYMAHVGGFIAGVVLLAVFRPRHSAIGSS
jgi:membrane associated rhomboid family serine protease